MKTPRRHRTAHGVIALTLGLGFGAVALGGLAYAHGDKDRDGYRHPAMMGPMHAAMLEEADGNGDGVIDRSELRAQHERLFGAFDTDGDGKVTVEEMRAGMIERRFSLMDSDGDGSLSREEFSAFAGQMGPGQMGSGMMGSGMMGSGQMGPGMMGRHGHWDDDHGRYHDGYHRMGRDDDDDDEDRRGRYYHMDEDGYGGMRGMMRDGSIDRDELDGLTERMFRMMDRNADGRIEADERMR